MISDLERRPGLDAIISELRKDRPHMNEENILALAKDEWHRRHDKERPQEGGRHAY